MRTDSNSHSGIGWIARVTSFVVALIAAAGASAGAGERAIAPYIPSPQSVVADMLELAEVGPDDFVIDLGSGDGRIVLTAATVFGASGLGVEIKDELVQRANRAARLAGVSDRVTFAVQDLFETDISRATVLTLYLLPETVNQLEPKLLAELEPGTRVLSHDYPIERWTPDRFVQMHLEDKVRVTGVPTTNIYLYVVPANVAGGWRVELPAEVGLESLTLALDQERSRVSGTAHVDGRPVALENVALRGRDLEFTLPDGRGAFVGRVEGDHMQGTVSVNGSRHAWRAMQNTVPVTPPG